MSWPTPGRETKAHGKDKNPSLHPAGHRRKQMWEAANVQMSLGSQRGNERGIVDFCRTGCLRKSESKNELEERA